MHRSGIRWIAWVFTTLLLLGPWSVFGTTLQQDRAELEALWQSRIQTFIDKGVIPLIDLEASLKPEDMQRYMDAALPVMDELGIAMIAFDGYQRPRNGSKEKGYRWSDYILRLVNAHPARFIPTTNGGTNKNWFKQKDSFISQTEKQVKSGTYAIMAEMEFRHYMSGVVS